MSNRARERESDPNRRRKHIICVLVALCLVLTILCACLVATVALLRIHFQPPEADPEDVVMPVVKPTSPSPQLAREPWEEDFRLPANVLPLHYDLILHPDLVAGTFSGSVVIRLRVSERHAPYLAVHVKNLSVQSTELSGDGVHVPLFEAFPYAPHEQLVLAPQEQGGFPPGEYSLQLTFNGSLTNKIVGFYRSEYQDATTGLKRSIATSKFQPTYARQAFPCFDEPSFKSQFTVRLVRPSGDGYQALSNMDVEREEADQPASGLTTVYFRESVPMVTYLACFIVSDFQRLPPITISPGNFPFSVYSTPAQLAKTEYALHTGAAITEYYISYFDLAYPLPKLDMIAIPDFVSGAMEHWGLITYREANLLYDPSISSSSNKQRVATVIGHELAHMWFGNLVTLKWWDDLWLNEGFASYMEYKGVNSRHPDWAMMDQFLIDDLHPVLILDASLSSHPIVQQVEHPDEITELFDTISYNKGAAVIRMLEGFMGEASFQRGISNFLKAFQLSNAVTQDLWDALQRVVDENATEHINITRVMDTWTRQMGFPVLTVTEDGTGNRIISQRRFLADPNANTTGDVSPYGYVWEVPLTYVTSNSPTVRTVWLHSDKPNVIISLGNDTTWVKFNHHQVGYYRVNYTEREWQQFSNILQSTVTALHSSDRANLLEDAFSLADAGMLKYEVALQMTQYLKQEPDYVPWSVAASKIGHLNSLLSGTSAYPKLRAYVRTMVEDIYSNVTWTVTESDSHLQRRLRAVVLDLACTVGLGKCLQEASTEFSKWLSDPEVRPNPDMRSLVYHYGMAINGNENNWDTMWRLYLAEGDAQEKTKLLLGLSSTHEPWLLQRFIENAKIESNVRSQDFFTVLTYIANNPVGNSIVWDFVRSEWGYLVDRFTLNNRYLGRLIPSITKSFATPFKLREMEAFFEQYPEAGAGKAARSQALETVSNNILWLQKHQSTVNNWLSLNAPSL